MAGARPGQRRDGHPDRRDPRRALGAAGEAVVARWYEARGYTVVDRNWRCGEGELDLVLRAPGVVVFCEVKTRRGSRFVEPAQAVTRAKQGRIRRLSLRWLTEHEVHAAEVRFDVASVVAARVGATVEVTEGAF